MLRAEADWRQRRCVVIAARTRAAQWEVIARWVRTLGWLLLGAVLSNTGQLLSHADLWFNAWAAQEILTRTELVVQFSSSLTGKHLLARQADCSAKMLWILDSCPLAAILAITTGGVFSPMSRRAGRDIHPW